MKILVTGSEGFIGKHVCQALKERGHHVIGLDTAASADIVADITKAMPLMEVDAVVHLAAVAAPIICDDSPGLAFRVNVLGTQQILRLALESGAKKFVFSSSAHVYGISPKYLPTDECHPLWLQNTYTTTKILGEQLCQLFYENHGLNYTTLRLFNAYGPGQGLGYFIPDMIKKAKQGYVDLTGKETTKDFVHISDVTRAFVLALETKFVGEINIGTGVETRLSDIALRIADGWGAIFTHNNSGSGTRMCADWSRANRILGWKPTQYIEEGLLGIFDHEKSRSLVS